MKHNRNPSRSGHRFALSNKVNPILFPAVFTPLLFCLLLTFTMSCERRTPESNSEIITEDADVTDDPVTEKTDEYEEFDLTDLEISVELDLSPGDEDISYDFEYRSDFPFPPHGDMEGDETYACPVSWPDNCDTQRSELDAETAWVRAATMNGLRELEYTPLDWHCQEVEVILAFQGCYHFWLILDAGNFPIDGDESALWAQATLSHGEEIIATLSPNNIHLERATDTEDIYQSEMGTVIFEYCGALDMFDWPNRAIGCPATLTVILQNGEDEETPGPLLEPLVDSLTVVPVWVSQ